MYRIGIDVGSTYTKYCVREDDKIIALFSEKTPLKQKEYFEKKINELLSEYPDANIISCGYGRDNISAMKSVNELIALAKGCQFMNYQNEIVLDIGGQDTKVIVQKKGKIKEFFLNDRCAAGSGMFLSSALNMLGIRFEDIDFSIIADENIQLSSVCAVFAQSEIVDLIASNIDGMQIVYAVIRQILVQAKKLTGKTVGNKILLSGGLSKINGIQTLVSEILGKESVIIEQGQYLSAIGCTVENY